MRDPPQPPALVVFEYRVYPTTSSLVHWCRTSTARSCSLVFFVGDLRTSLLSSGHPQRSWRIKTIYEKNYNWEKGLTLLSHFVILASWVCLLNENTPKMLLEFETKPTAKNLPLKAIWVLQILISCSISCPKSTFYLSTFWPFSVYETVYTKASRLLIVTKKTSPLTPTNLWIEVTASSLALWPLPSYSHLLRFHVKMWPLLVPMYAWVVASLNATHVTFPYCLSSTCFDLMINLSSKI